MEPADFKQEFITHGEAITLLGTGRSIFYQRRRDGALPAEEVIDGRPYYRRADIAALMQAGGILKRPSPRRAK